MNENFYCVCSLCDGDRYFASYEQAVSYAKEIAEKNQCGNVIYQNGAIVGTCEWDGYELLGNGGYVGRYKYEDMPWYRR